MPLDPNGAKGVSRAPLPNNPWLCTICHDLGTHFVTGEHNFCGCPAGVAKRAAEPNLCAEANETLAKLNRKIAAKR